MLLTDGDNEKREKIFKLIERFGLLLSILSFVGGLVYFCLLPHEDFVHKTYLSENALSPGLVSSDIHSSDLLNYYHDLLKDHLESQKTGKFDANFINSLFVKYAHIESYIQNFNVSDPFIKSKIAYGTNIYAYGRAYRTDGTESIVVSASQFFIDKNGSKVPNFGGIAELFVMADLVRTRPYWAKDLIFLISDMEYIGTQAFVNSYFEINSPYIDSENLKKRGGSIQAALNLELKDLVSDRIEIKIEGSNGKLPNLDLFNAIIRICKSVNFKCSLYDEQAPSWGTHPYKPDPVAHLDGLYNTVAMVLRQATGMPTSSHGFFIEQRIEALTITGRSSSTQTNLKNLRQNTLKLTRIIESTLRSVNNLLERFHQSFFFYLLASSNHYISIGMYMPAFGLVCLPLLVQMIKTWCTIFMDETCATVKESSVKKNIKNNFFWFAVPNVFVSLAFGCLLQFGVPWFISYGLRLGFRPEESLLFSYMAICFYIIFAPFLTNRFKLKSLSSFSTEKNRKILNFLALTTLVIFMGGLALLNFSLAFLIAISYVPVSILSIKKSNSIIFKAVQLVFLILTMPFIYFSIFYAIYTVYFDKSSLVSLNGNIELLNQIQNEFYNFSVVSKLTNVWTMSLINIFLMPIWSLLWFISFQKDQQHD